MHKLHSNASVPDLYFPVKIAIYFYIIINVLIIIDFFLNLVSGMHQ